MGEIMFEFKKEKVEQIYDLIIIGSGPAGMTAAVYASRNGLKVAILDMTPGGKLNETSEIENWPGDTMIMGPELAQRMAAHSTQFGAEFIFGQAEKVEDLGKYKQVETFDKILQAKSILIATGTVERKLGIPGEQEYYGNGVSYCAVCDAAFFKDEDVIVIGGGNSAYEAAEYLSRFAKNVYQVLRRDVIRASQIVVNRVEKRDNIKTMFSYSPIEIKGTNGKVSSVLFVNNKDKDADPIEIKASAIFPAIGILPNTDFIKNLDILDEDNYVIVDEKMRTPIKGIYAAGDVIAKELRQIVTATNDGSIAGENIADYILNDFDDEI